MADLLNETLSYMIYIAVAWIAVQVRKFVGIQLDKKAQDDLHRAALTAAHAAIARGMNQMQAVSHIQGYLEASVPDALKRLMPSPPVVHEIAKAKLAEAAK